MDWSYISTTETAESLNSRGNWTTHYWMKENVSNVSTMPTVYFMSAECFDIWYWTKYSPLLGLPTHTVTLSLFIINIHLCCFAVLWSINVLHTFWALSFVLICQSSLDTVLPLGLDITVMTWTTFNSPNGIFSSMPQAHQNVEIQLQKKRSFENFENVIWWFINVLCLI